MQRIKKAALIALPTAALVIGSGVGVGMAAPTSEVATQTRTTVSATTSRTADQIRDRIGAADRTRDRDRDGTCPYDGVPARDQDRVRDRDRVHVTPVAKAQTQLRTHMNTQQFHGHAGHHGSHR